MRRRIALWSLIVVVVLVVVAGVAWFTPALSVRTVDIRGLKAVPQEQVREVLRIPEGISMLRIDTDAVAQRVAALPKVRSARVQRVFPATVRVTVDERVAVLFFDGPEGSHLLDGDSVEFAVEPAPPGVPKLTTDHPGSDDPVTRAAVAVLAAVPQALRAQVGEVVARTVSDIALNLTDGRTVLWGGPGDSGRKAAVVLPVLTRPGTVFDVSSPDLVTVK
nr:FtsQ-type POTRA domain-containing protein [Nocardia pseudobrasiliensis]